MPHQGHGEMSAKFKEQEEKNEQETLEREAVEAEKRTVVFWAPASGYKIGNWVKEEWSGGRCIQHEASLAFMNHILVADPETEDGKKVIAFLEKSDGYRNGVIKKCKDMAEAMMHTAKLQSMRKVTQLKCEDVSSTNYKLE